MDDHTQLYEREIDDATPDLDEVPIQDRHVFTQPYDLVVESLLDQIEGGTIFLRPISERPAFQRRYVWNDTLASRLIESILLNVPIPPCYLSQNEDYELDVIDGQQRLYSIYRFLQNEFALTDLEVLKELIGHRFRELLPKIQRQLKTHTLRLVAVTNDSHPEVKFDVFQRLNTNTTPLNAQELRNCVYRGALNDLLKRAVIYQPWLTILNRRNADKRMRDEELALRFFGFHVHGIESYRTPQKHWLNDVAKKGQRYPEDRIEELYTAWTRAIDVSLLWFEPLECFRRETEGKRRPINRALFDLTMASAAKVARGEAAAKRMSLRAQYVHLLQDEKFGDLIGRAVDHKKRTRRRFEIWEDVIGPVLS